MKKKKIIKKDKKIKEISDKIDNRYILEMTNVTYSYDNSRKILDNAGYKFEKGKFYAIIGPSGSGKTTALSLIGGLDKPNKGKILFKGKDIKDIGYTNYRRDNIVMVFQSYNLINYMTAYENVMLGMEITHTHKKKRKEKAIELLQEVELKQTEMFRNVMKLSGGQQQRVAIARALGEDADIVLADEPTGNLDKKTSEEIVKIFKDLAIKKDKCVILVTHSTDVSKEADIILKVDDGKILEVNNNQ